MLVIATFCMKSMQEKHAWQSLAAAYREPCRNTENHTSVVLGFIKKRFWNQIFNSLVSNSSGSVMMSGKM